MGVILVNCNPVVHVTVSDDGEVLAATATTGYRLHRDTPALDVQVAVADLDGSILSALKVAAVQSQAAFDTLAAATWSEYANLATKCKIGIRWCYARLAL